MVRLIVSIILIPSLRGGYRERFLRNWGMLS
jgi:hypothetical protein